MKINFKPAVDVIIKSQKIGLITHVRGDGDAFGSLLAMRDILLQLNKEVVIFSNEEIPKHLGYLKKFSKYKYKEKYEDIDLLIALDANTINRLTLPEVFKVVSDEKIKTILIDHHELNGLDNDVDVDITTTKVSSASELVYGLAKELKIEFTKEISDYLFIGIETDTNFLNNPNTYKSTIEARKDLLSKGVEEKVVHKMLEQDSLLGNNKFIEEIEKRVVNNSGIISAYILEEDYIKFKVEVGASSPISSYLDQKYNAKITLVAEQRDKDNVKVSMRSNKSGLDVSELASFFGGGGHKQAAGFEYQGKLSDLLSGK